ncbi:hypothetical protein N9811_05015 [Bacteroidia bacterium]|nr:hypothetical protein [Bacteroidia bacterium]
MATFYIIHSKSTETFYTGSTTDFAMQFEQHKRGHFPQGFKSSARDWESYITIPDIDIETANRMVKHIKKSKAKDYIESLRADSTHLDQLVIDLTNKRDK